MKLHARLVKRYPPSVESAGFTLDLELACESGVTVLFGASGSGKSLTLDCIAGFAQPDSGRILLGDRLLFDGAAGVHMDPQSRLCGYVFQNYALFPHMTIRDNLMFAAERRPRLDRHRRVNEMIERFHLEGIAGRFPNAVSGGQRQRCSIARSLVATPQVLLFDEPGRGLDAELRGELYVLLRDLQKDFGIPMLFVTHDLDEAVAVGDHLLVLDLGKIVQAGSPQSVISRPVDAVVARLFGYTNLVAMKVLALDPGRKTSRLRFEGHDLTGPYFPGHLIGDTAHLVLRADDLRVHSEPGENRVAMRLKTRIDHARFVELRFPGISALVPRSDYESRSDLLDWYVEIPPTALRLPGSN